MQQKVFPTQVGVFPKNQRPVVLQRGLPHAGGGVSIGQVNGQLPPVSSPRRWGCFYFAYHRSAVGYVFPTQVGVFLRPALPPRRVECLPHAGGGVSQIKNELPMPDRSSPRRWGCFYNFDGGAAAFRVFPTQVGVFPEQVKLPLALSSLPHAGGGVSFGLMIKHAHQGLPHAGGGVSKPICCYSC